MAMAMIYNCSHCGYSIEAWDDGNPYFLSYSGKRQCFYHPSGESLLESYKMQYLMDFGQELLGLGKHVVMKKRISSAHSSPDTATSDDDGFSDRIGNMTDMLCLDCGREFKRDLERDKAVCPSRKCRSTNIVGVYELDGKPCPKCRQGVFKTDPDDRAIS